MRALKPPFSPEPAGQHPSANGHVTDQPSSLTDRTQARLFSLSEDSLPPTFAGSRSGLVGLLSGLKLTSPQGPFLPDLRWLLMSATLSLLQASQDPVVF